MWFVWHNNVDKVGVLSAVADPCNEVFLVHIQFLICVSKNLSLPGMRQTDQCPMLCSPSLHMHRETLR